MTRLGQKKHELWILKSFLEALGEDAPGGLSSFESSEGPDFLMGQVRPCPLGIELFELNHTHSLGSGLRLRQEEGIQEHLCRTIERRWDTANMPVAEVSVHLMGHHFPQSYHVAEKEKSVLAGSGITVLP
jgi:hypothetical protein